jgi:hypothetical protein
VASWPWIFIAALYALPAPVTVSVYPTFGMPPAMFRITVLAPRHAENRLLCFAADGPELRRSCQTLHGEASQRVWTVYWTVRTPGAYVAEAILTRMEDGRARIYVSREPFRVVGDVEPDP